MKKNTNIKSLPDEDLVLYYKQSKRQEYIGELYSRYAHLVYGVCLKYLKHIENAQDTTMLIFEKLTMNLTKHTIISFKSWLYQVSKTNV